MLGCIPIILLKGVVCKENSRRPRTESCGTPNSSSHHSERIDSILIAWSWEHVTKPFDFLLKKKAERFAEDLSDR